MDNGIRKSAETKDRGALRFDEARRGFDAGEAWPHWQTGSLPKAINPLLWFRLLWNVARAGLRAVTPRFAAPDDTRARRSSTAYLDGLRGIAAFVVLIHHFSKDPFPWLPWGWGSVRNDVPQHHFLQLPVIRLVHSGPSMVAVFFVISGFALSCSPLKHIRRHETGRVSSTLASSVFRRVMRLYLPCVATTLFMAVVLQLRLAPFPSHRKPEANVFAELRSWLLSMHSIANPFDLSFILPRYDDNLWTIPVELRGSMALFLVLLGLSRTRYRIRVVLEVVITIWLLSYGFWDVALFIAGLVLAELHFERQAAAANIRASDLPTSHTNATNKDQGRSTSRSSTFSQYRPHVIRFFLFSLSICLASAPLVGFDSSPIYSSISLLTPPSWRRRDVADRFIPTIAAPLLVFCVDRSAAARRFLNGAIGRYLGRISFALYLVHGPVRYTIYHPIMEAIMRGLGLSVVLSGKQEGKTEVWLKGVEWLGLDHLVGSGKGLEADRAKLQAQIEAKTAFEPRFLASVIITWLIVIPVTMGLSEWFARVVDDGSVTLARRVEARWADDTLGQGLRGNGNGDRMDEAGRDSPSEREKRMQM